MNLAEVTDLIERYGALQNPREVLCLLEFLGRNPPKVMVEVGVWKGGNVAILKTAFPDLRIIGVDEIYPDEKVIERFGLELVVGSSHSSDTVTQVRALIGGLADYIFIDASHDTDSVLRDFELWSPLGRLIGFHDVHNPMVFEAWLQVTGLQQPDPRTFALYKEPDGHGIGLVVMH